MALVKLISQAEYAKHRGVSEAAVSKAISAKRITLTADGKIDPVAADAQWARNTRVRAGSGQSGGSVASAAGGVVVPSSKADALAGIAALEHAARGRELNAGAGAGAGAGDAKPGDDNYWQSRGRREMAEAEMAELELAEMRGELVRVKAIRSELGALLASLREGLMQIPSRLSPVVAAETDAVKVHDAIAHEIHQSLEQLTNTHAKMEAAAA